MDVRLFVAHSKPDAKQIALGPETLIGRSPECNLRIASGQVSRRHCVIKVDGERVCVRDLGSANGTRLNGQAITAEVDVAVPPGSTLVVGPLKFIVQFTGPRIDEDTELLARSDSAGSADVNEVQQMATAPVADGEETKDYPSSRARKRAGAPPVVAESDRQEASGDDPGPQRQPRTTEAEFEAMANETVFDGLLEGDGPGATTGERRPQVGDGTDLFFEEDDLQQLAATIEAAEDSPRPGAADSPPVTAGTTVPPDPSKPQTGWRLLDMLRRKRQPAEPHSSPGAVPADDADEALRNFLKDQ